MISREKPENSEQQSVSVSALNGDDAEIMVSRIFYKNVPLRRAKGA